MTDMATSDATVVHDVTTTATGDTLRHVLVADPNDNSRDQRGTKLRGSGYHVTLARTTFEAIVKACCHVPDLVLIDEGLGKVEVAETARLLATCPVTAHIPVVKLGPGRRLTERILARLQRALA